MAHPTLATAALLSKVLPVTRLHQGHAGAPAKSSWGTGNGAPAWPRQAGEEGWGEQQRHPARGRQMVRTVPKEKAEHRFTALPTLCVPSLSFLSPWFFSHIAKSLF